MFKVLVLLSLSLSSAFAFEATPTGIPLDQDWKVKLNEFAKKSLVHPAWGYAHAERDYQNTLWLAKSEKIAIDEEVLFAAAFLHDLGGLPPYAKEGVDHGVRSVEVGIPMLISFGFPSSKTDAVKEIIIGHVYYGPMPKGKVAKLFRDADIIDFLGTIGVSRLLAANAELGIPPAISNSIGVIKKFIDKMPKELYSKTAKADAAKRIQEMNTFLKSLEKYTFQGKAL